MINPIEICHISSVEIILFHPNYHFDFTLLLELLKFTIDPQNCNTILMSPLPSVLTLRLTKFSIEWPIYPQLSVLKRMVNWSFNNKLH